MNQAHREVLRKHRVFLVKELMVDILWPSLLEHDVFTNEMLEHIQATGARPSQVHRLLSDLTRRGPLAFDKFLLCLDETDQSHVADKLREAADAVAAHEPSYDRFSKKASYVRPVSKYTGSSASTSPLPIASSTPLSPFDCGPNARDSFGLTCPAARRPLPVDNRKPTADWDGGSGSSSGSSSNGGSGAWQKNNSDDRRPDVRHSPAPQDAHSFRPPQTRDACGRPPTAGSPPAAGLAEHHLEGTNAAAATGCQTTALDGTPRPPADAAAPLASSAEDGWSFATARTLDNHPDVQLPLPQEVLSPTHRPLAGSASSQPATAVSPASGSRRPDWAARMPPHRARSNDVVSLRVDSSRPPKTDRARSEYADGPADVDCSATIRSEVALGAVGKAVAMPSKGMEIMTDDLVMTTDDLIMPNWNKLYKMTSTPRGYCVIINNRHFSGHLRERIGTDVDCDNLYRLFSQLGYMISIKEDLTAMEMLVTLRDFALLDRHALVDSCAVVLLTHGLDGQVYGCDCRLIDLNEVFTYFDGHHCPALKGKPKIMFIQACRGEKYDVGFESTDSPGSPPIGERADDMLIMPSFDNCWAKKLPSCSDFLIAYATIPGHVSWRNSEEGSWFVKAFCEVFSRNAHHDDATSMLVEVNDRVATAYESATGHKQMPAPVVLLRKKLYFYPPLISPGMLMPR